MSESARSRKRDLNASQKTQDGYNNNCDEPDECTFKTRRTDQLVDCNNSDVLENWIRNLSKKYPLNHSSNHNSNPNNTISLEVEIRGLIKFVEKMVEQKTQKIVTENKFLSTLVKSQQETIRRLQDWERIANCYLQERNVLKAELNDLKESIAHAFVKPKANQPPNKSPFLHRPPPDIF
ncbi:hypothetical protein BMR1_03g02250 [Babesia microti strain RI]|uniref:Uncharacterized protein n=1 Tax=Babesia microti (strain RI) TaxID=1133968 RepID=A0A0K3AMV5_BABMR|nr:hypothetical protein BMR1_03g02250 [Babesia microti strain RI]CTQ41049.1 hypothetical protein BMR1_03g02250 [Babesia microti strain RI]|eukprot:XP_012649060.1 hypothetical protein BMR1_03g02250 [Babesia microti strain RI]